MTQQKTTLEEKGNKEKEREEIDGTTERLYHLDWLRVFLVLIVFTGHAIMFYVPVLGEGRVIYGGRPGVDIHNIGMSAYFLTLIAWVMPSFFVISGLGMYYALGTTTKKQYVKARVKRLMIPFIFGYIFGIVPIIIIDLIYNQGVKNPFGYFVGGHLYYLLFLVVFTIGFLPLFVHVRKKRDANEPSRSIAFFDKPGRFLLLAIPLATLEIVQAAIYYMPGAGGWMPFSYTFFFLFGGFLASNKKFHKMIARNLKIAIIVGVISFSLMVPLGLVMITNLNNPFWLLIFSLYALVTSIESLCVIFIIFHVARIKLNKNHKHLKFLTEIAMPLYIIHMVILVVVGLFVFPLGLIDFLGFLVITFISFVIILSLAVIIRKVNPLRFMFGLKVKKKQSEV